MVRTMSESTALIRTDQLSKLDEKDLIRAVAMDIGKQVAHHIEMMYPEAVKAASSTFLLSVRNCTHNEIVAWLETNMDTENRLAFNERFRRHIRALSKKNRQEDSPK
jgi:hypothetical protein